MHLFFDTVWKLHIGEIPEKPSNLGRGLSKIESLAFAIAVEKYNEAIAAIKQNALTVGNPRIIPRVGNDGFEIFKLDGNFNKWPGGYEIKKIKDGEIRITAGGHPFLGSKTVAILTLPEEKKNTMENMTKALEVARTLPCACSDCGMRETESAKKILEFAESLTVSGSVADPKHSTCSDIPFPLEPTECREIRPAITWEEIRNLHKENEELKLFLEDIRRIAFNGFSYKDRILDIQKKFPSR